MSGDAEALEDVIRFNKEYYTRLFEEPYSPKKGGLISPYDTPRGQHHDFLFYRVLKVAREGADQALLEDLVKKYCEKTGHDSKDGQKIVEYVYKYLGRGDRQVASLNPLDAHTLLSQPAPRAEWVVENLFEKGMSILLYGSGGEGKSTLLYDMCVDISKGSRCLAPPEEKGSDTALLGRKTSKCRVVYFDLEEGKGTIHRRLERLTLARNTLLDPRSFLIICDLVDLTKRDQQELVREKLKELSSDGANLLVVFDSFIRCCGSGNENQAADVAPVTNFLTQQLAHEDGHTVILLHHKNKAGTMKGSLELINGVDAAIELSAPKGVNNPDRVLLKQKCRGEDIVNLSFKRVYANGGFYMEEVVPQSRDEEKANERLLREREILGLFEGRDTTLNWSSIRRLFKNEDLTKEALDALVRDGELASSRGEFNSVLYKRNLDNI